MAQQNILDLGIGSKVSFKGTNYFINSQIDLKYVILSHPTTQEIKRAEISKLNVPIEEESFSTQTRDIIDIADKDLQEAQKRLLIVKQALANPANIESICKEYKVSDISIYRWKKAFLAS